jgi:two-component system OmpR family response regulator
MKRSHTIAFIDDDRDFLAAQRAFFGARGFTVLAAESAEGGRALLEGEHADVIVVDLMMEHYDSGARLSHAIRKDPRYREVPIIMLSGVAAATGRRLEIDAAGLAQWSHLDLFLDKPISARELLRVVQDRLPKAAAPTE